MSDEILAYGRHMFRPRFKDLAKDHDRLEDRIIELSDQGHLTKEKDQSLYGQFVWPAAERLLDAYFAHGLYAEIEAYHTYTGEIAFGWPYDTLRSVFDRMVEAGEGPRAIRLWRNHLALMKPHFWFLLDARKRGFEPVDYVGADMDEQRAKYDQMIGGIDAMKADLLAMMDAARGCFLRAGATEGQLAQLAQDRAKIATETRHSPGKPDPRPMDEDLFWEVIGTPGTDGIAAQIDTLPARLAQFKAPAIKAFDTLLHQMDARAYRSDIWALAYLLRGGCSDDAFAGFRCWLILQGRARFEATLADPDDFDVTDANIGECGTLWDVPLLAHEMRTGKVMKRKRHLLPDLAGPTLEEEDFALHLPKVAAALDGDTRH